MSQPALRGVVPILPTPFDASGAILWDEFAPVIDFQIANRVHAIAALGLGGEAASLTTGERIAIAERVVGDVAGRLPVVIGTSADDRETACRLTRHAAGVGAAAVMASPPNRAGLTEDALFDHYLAICDAADGIDVMVQDAPAFIAVSLGAHFVARLARARSNVRYAKTEAFPAAERTAELVAADAALGIFGGASGLHYVDVLEAGAIGIIPGCEAPVEFVAIFDAFEAGDVEEARRLFARLQPLLVFEIQTLAIFLASTKAILKRRGLISSDALRGPNPLGSYSREVLMRHAARALGLDAKGTA